MISNPHPFRNPRKALAANALLLVGGLLIGLLIAESLVRWLAPHPRYPALVVPDEKVGFLLQRGAVGRAANREGEYDTEMRINAEGFRDRNHPLAKPAGKVRIAFLGDSFTCAEQVEETESFVRRVETILNASPGSASGVECLNFGIGGYDTQQEVLCYEEYVRPYRPDLVVLAAYPHNDLTGNLFYRTERDFGRPYYRMEDGALRKIAADPARLEENHRKSRRREKLHWYHHLQTYNAQRAFFHRLRQARQRRNDLAAVPAPTNGVADEKLWKVLGYRKYRYYAGDGSDPYIQDVEAISTLLLRRLRDAVEKDGARFGVVLLPAEENLWPERWPTRVRRFPGMEGLTMDFDRPFRRIQDFLPELATKGDVLDLRPALREAAKQGPVFFGQDFHYTAYGHRAVADAIAAWLVARLNSAR